MGCGSSKVEDLPVVAFCRERRDLIRAAVDHRFAFAACHESYFRALEGVGEALQRFVQEELTVVPTPSSSSGTPSSPVLTIPSSEGKTPKPKGGSPANSAASGAIASGGGSSSSPASHLHSLSPEGSHLHLSTDSDSDEIPESGGNGGGGVPYSYASLEVPSPRYSYMRHSTAIPAMVYEAPYAGYGYLSPSGLPDGYFGTPMNSNHEGDPSSYYYNGPQMPPQVPPPTPPEIPPPPAPEVSTWDFLNPFQSYEQIYSSSYRLGSPSSSPDSNEVREQEGIPDLEEETESEPSSIPTKRKKMNVNASAEPGPSSSKAVPTSDKHVTDTEDKGGRNSSVGSNLKSSGGSSTNRGSGDGSASNSSGKGSKTRCSGDESKPKDIEEEEARKKEVTFELETSPPTDNSGPTLETALSTEGSRNITAVTMEIKEQFKLAATSGREVSAMLEVGKLRYQSRNAMLKVFSSRILDYFPILAHSYHTLKGAHYSTTHSLKSSKISVRSSGNLLNVKYGNLSTTLEKLSVWEKKLYKEVKDEEKLRLIYEKQCKRLRSLDNMGAEPHKIDATRASIRKLLTKIDVTIKSIVVISNRIHKLRDDELQPQLIKLLHGLRRMWNSMLDCHQKQFLAIVDSRSRNLMAKTSIQGVSMARLTKEFESELLKWLSSFNDWINIQKIYFRTLNEWLQKCLNVEQEETPDGLRPYSPGRMGAPPTFIICHDWCEAMDKISDDEALIAVQSFAAAIHALRVSQDEDERHIQKAEYLTKDITSRLRSLQIETGLPVLQGALSDTAISLPENAGATLDHRLVALESMRKRLEEEKAKHEEIIKQINAVASSGLRRGLIQVFHALGSFSVETIKAYEKIRTPGSEGT